MPEDPNIIFKLSLDDSGFIVPINRGIAGWQKFEDAQRQANITLISNREALRKNAEQLEAARQALANYTGTNEDYRKELQVSVDKAQFNQQELISLVDASQKAYDKANTSAQEFLTTAQKAQAVVQSGTGAPGATLAPAQLDLFNPPPTPPVPPTGTQLDLSFIGDLQNLVPDTTSLVADLTEQMKLLKEEMDTLDPQSEKWKELNEVFQKLTGVVALAKGQLEDTGSVINESGQKYVSLRTQLLNLRNEMSRLAEEGKINTQEFRDMAAEAGHLTRVYREQQERIRVLSSENRALDFGKAAIRGAIGAFETFTSVSVLFGKKNEELEKQTLKLFAAMQLLNGLEELTTLARKSSTVAIGIETAATSIYTAVVGAATGATKALRIALLSTGIGAVVVGLGLLIKHFIDLKAAQEKANEEAKITNEINEKAVSGYASQVANLEILKDQLTDMTVSEEKRTELAKEYNKTADEGNKIDVERINQTGLLTAAINRQEDAIRSRALAQAGVTVTDEKANTVFSEQQKIIEKLPDLEKVLTVPPEKLNRILNQAKEAAVSIFQGADNEIEAAAKFAEAKQAGKFKELGDLTTAQLHQIIQLIIDGDVKVFQTGVEELDKAAKLAAGLQLKLPEPPKVDESTVAAQRARLEAAIKENDRLFAESKGKNEAFKANLIAENKVYQKQLDDLTLKEAKVGGAVQNTFLQQQAELNRQLADLEASTTTTVESISKKFETRLTEEKAKLAEEVKKKSITQKQAGELLEIFVKINTEQERVEIEKFKKDQLEAQKQIQDQVNALEQKARIDTINNIQDEFTRRKALIEQNEQDELAARKKGEDALLATLNEKKDLGTITEQQYYDDLHNIIEAGEVESTAITIKYAQQRQDLSIAIFKNTLDKYQQAIKDVNATLDADTATFVRSAADRFLSGGINFQQFKKQTDDFIEQQDSASRKNVIRNNTAEIFEIDHKLSTIRDHTTKNYKDLLKARQDLSEQTNKLITADAEADAESKNKVQQEKIDNIIAYADAIGNVATSVIGFWQAANEAESRALDRSIALQQRRVDEAIRIADKGNATYLKAEKDRLKQLEVERENSARRQLGIDAALQASQILVGITGAIAKIGTGTPAETIADIAIIIGALATGYGLVKQLQANQPRLKEGTPYVQRGSNRSGVDTIPAWLNEGEAVIPTDRNKKYKPVVEAIYHEKIPAEVLNDFVRGNTKNIRELKTSELKNYKQVVDKTFVNTTIKHVPIPNYEHIAEVNGVKSSEDTRMRLLMEEHTSVLKQNNEHQKETQRILKAMDFSIKFDKEGVSAMIMKYIEQKKIDSKI